MYWLYSISSNTCTFGCKKLQNAKQSLPHFFDTFWPQKKEDYERLTLNSSVKNAGLLTTAPWLVMIKFREVSSQDLAQNGRFPGMMGTKVDRTKMARFFLLPLPQSHVPVSVAWCTHGRGAVFARTWACLMARRQPASPSLDSLTRIKAEIEPGRHMEQLAIIHIMYRYLFSIWRRTRSVLRHRLLFPSKLLFFWIVLKNICNIRTIQNSLRCPFWQQIKYQRSWS